MTAMLRWLAHRRDVVGACRRLVEQGLVVGRSGNVSVRIPKDDGYLVAITPSRLSYADLTEEAVLVLDAEGEPVEGDLMPSSETALHLEVYRRRPDVGAVVHTHPLYASVLAVAGLELPPIIDEMVISVGGPVAVSEYAFPGTEELAGRACEALGERNAVILRNHGLVAVGSDLEGALEVSALVERVAHIYVTARLLGQVAPLPGEVVRIEQEIFRMQRGAPGGL